MSTVLKDTSRNIPDANLHPSAQYGIEPRQRLFVDISKARRAFVQKINEQLRRINIIKSTLPWKQQLEVTDKMVNRIEVDLTRYWDFIDWQNEEVGTVDFEIESRAGLAGLSPNNNQLASFTEDGKLHIYKWHDNQWVLIFHEDGTIEFNELLWDEEADQAGWDTSPFDSDEWDHSSGEAMTCFLTAFRDHLWINQYRQFYNELFLHLMRYTLQEQESLDWLIKSSSIKVEVCVPIQSSFDKLFPDNFDSLEEYYRTTKAFRSKFSDIVTKQITDENVPNRFDTTAEFLIETGDAGDTTAARATRRSFRRVIINDETVSFGDPAVDKIVDSGKWLLASDISSDANKIPLIKLETTSSYYHNITSITRQDNSTVRIRFDSNHAFDTGDMIIINGVSGTDANLFNGLVFTATRIDEDEIDISVTNTGSITATGGTAADTDVSDPDGLSGWDITPWDTVGWDRSNATDATTISNGTIWLNGEKITFTISTDTDMTSKIISDLSSNLKNSIEEIILIDASRGVSNTLQQKHQFLSVAYLESDNAGDTVGHIGTTTTYDDMIDFIEILACEPQENVNKFKTKVGIEVNRE